MKTKEMVFAAIFAALLGALGLIPPIPLGFIPVPITAQTLGVMLAGCFLGKKTGSLSMVLFIVLVAIGLPLLPGGRGGIAVFAGPTAGYILSWPVAAWCIGYMTEKIWTKVAIWKLIIINFIFGVLLVSLIGAPIMALITHTSVWAGITGSAVYLPGDCIKAAIAAVLAVQLKAVSPIGDKA